MDHWNYRSIFSHQSLNIFDIWSIMTWENPRPVLFWVMASNLIIWTSKLRGLIISKQWNRVFSARLKGEGTHCALTYEETKRPSRSKAVFKEPHIHIYMHTYMCMYFKILKPSIWKKKGLCLLSKDSGSQMTVWNYFITSV